MAFATSNSRLGSAGDKWTLTGDFTSTAGDTTGTITVGGTRVYDANFLVQDTIGNNRILDYSIATVGQVSTVTVSLAGREISGGRFSITYV